MHDERARLKQGYARLLGASPMDFDRGGLVIVETELRDQPEWANWVLPIWFVAIERATVCSVSPEYASAVRAAFGDVAHGSLLQPNLAEIGRRITSGGVWLQREIFFYPEQRPPASAMTHRVEQLRPGVQEGDELLRRFDGDVYVTRDNEYICAYAGIKDKRLLGEIAVNVDREYRRKGLGKAVVAHAVNGILARGNVPIYIPNELTNTASYGLADALGFRKVGEMLACEYELPNWNGFPPW